jgi:hypothetical protein
MVVYMFLVEITTNSATTQKKKRKELFFDYVKADSYINQEMDSIQAIKTIESIEEDGTINARHHSPICGRVDVIIEQIRVNE